LWDPDSREKHSWLTQPTAIILGYPAQSRNFLGGQGRGCTGDGSGGGDATNANGAFILGPAQSVASLTDGTSLTVAASEQLLGMPGPYSQTRLQ